MKRLSYFILLFLLSFSYRGVIAQTFDERDLHTYIEFLASDKLGGRDPGTRGEHLARHYIVREFRRYELLGRGTHKHHFIQKFTYKVAVNPHDTLVKYKHKTGTNIIAYINNNARKTIVIGAHYDHLGKAAHNSSLDKNNMKGVIHNGADDNASGTAGVMLLAKYFKTNQLIEHSNLLFILFSGEEDGLVGSKYWTHHPTIDTSKIICMINLDMIGRLNDSTRKLVVYGVGTSPDFNEIFKSVYLDDFNMVYDSSGMGPSDQTSFYLKNYPVLHFFTGQHADYHRSTDDFEKINYKGEMHVLTLVARIITKLSYKDSLLFTHTQQSEQDKISFKVTLGLMPDYTFDGKGMRIDGVTPGKPAEKAGIKGGDIMIKMGEIKIENVYDYMKALSKFKKGDRTEVEIERNKESIKLRVAF